LNINVHESGRASLPVDSDVVNYFENHLIDVKTQKNENGKEITTLTFDNNQFPDKLTMESSQYIYGLKNIIGNKLIYEEDDYVIMNQDVISVVENIKRILRQGNIPQPPIGINPVVSYYIEMMTALLEVGRIYSSFVEILFCNMFVVDYDKKVFWRYRQDLLPTFKLGDKMMAAYISSRIGLLYQPNKNTIEKVDLEELDLIDDDNLTIYEKIYLGKI